MITAINNVSRVKKLDLNTDQRRLLFEQALSILQGKLQPFTIGVGKGALEINVAFCKKFVQENASWAIRNEPGVYKSRIRETIGEVAKQYPGLVTSNGFAKLQPVA